MEIITDTYHIDFGKIRFQLIQGLIKNFKPKELYVCWVDNWFDSKWLNFSGKVVGALGVWNSENVTIPPFHPNRITSETIFDRQEAPATAESSVYKIRKSENPIHIKQPSGQNLNRKIKQIATDALFIWANKSADTHHVDCMMVYIIKDNEVITFYVSLENKPEKEKEDHWSFHKMVGTNADYLLQWMDKGKTYELNFDVD